MAVSVVLKRSLFCSVLLVLLSCSLLGQAESLIKRRSSDEFDTDLEEALSPKTDSSSRLLLKIYDAVVQDAIERGATSQEVDGLLRKRSGLRKCFFHAVNCW